MHIGLRNLQGQHELLAMLSGEDRSMKARLIRAAAATLEPVYSAAIEFRNAGFDREWRMVHRAHCPVISIGNLTTGGTGKTPMVIETVKLLRRLDRTPAVILRGYKSTPESGSDEATLLRKQLGDVPVIVNPNRVAAAQHVQRELPAVDVLVLDDGFQHRRIARDLDIVLIDAGRPFGFDHLLPRGLLREPLTSLRRADAVIVTHADLLNTSEREQLDARIAQYHSRAPLGHTSHTWAGIVDDHDYRVRTAEFHRPVILAVCGLGDPRKFFTEASRMFNVVQSLALADHQVYDAQLMRHLRQAVEKYHPAALLTTEKDWVKLQPLIESQPLGAPVWRPVLTLKWSDGEAAYSQLLRNRFNR